MKTNLTSTLAILATVFTVYSGCAPQAKNAEVVNAHQATSKSSIFGGTTANADFQKENGIVGLVIFTERSVPVLVGGKIVVRTQEGTALCTGSLIEKNVILTAAHCIVSFSSDTKIVAVAAYFKSDISTVTNEDLIFAVDAAVSPDFLKGVSDAVGTDEVVWNDIAMLKLQKDAPADFKLVKRLSKTDNVQIDATTKVVLSGFGVATPVVNKEQLNPRTGKLEVVPVPEKVSTSGVLRAVEDISVLSLSTDSKEIILNQTNSKGACHGDSGGPAFLKQTDGSLIQIGLTSRATDAKLGNCNKNAIYTNITSHIDWIEATTAAFLKATPAVDEQKPAVAEPLNP